MYALCERTGTTTEALALAFENAGESDKIVKRNTGTYEALFTEGEKAKNGPTKFTYSEGVARAVTKDDSKPSEEDNKQRNLKPSVLFRRGLSRARHRGAVRTDWLYLHSRSLRIRDVILFC